MDNKNKMFITIIKKIFLTIIAFSILIYSLASWRYYGDTYHLKTEIFKSNKTYKDDVYKIIWAMNIGKDRVKSNKIKIKIKMKRIEFYEIPSRLLKDVKKYPSEKIISSLINSKEWDKFIPNSKSATYKTFQTIWISQNLTIKEVINYYLKDIDKLSIDHYHKPFNLLNIKEIITILNLKNSKKYVKISKKR